MVNTLQRQGCCQGADYCCVSVGIAELPESPVVAQKRPLLPPSGTSGLGRRRSVGNLSKFPDFLDRLTGCETPDFCIPNRPRLKNPARSRPSRAFCIECGPSSGASPLASSSSPSRPRRAPRRAAGARSARPCRLRPHRAARAAGRLGAAQAPDRGGPGIRPLNPQAETENPADPARPRSRSSSTPS